MSEKDDNSKKSSDQKASTNEGERVLPYVISTDASSFIAQCRELLDKDKLAVPGDVDPTEKSSDSDILLSSLTERDLYNIHEQLFEAWKTKKSENIKVLPTLNPPKSWSPQEAIEDEETRDSFESALSKFDVKAYSQIADRPVSPDLRDLYNSEIRVVSNALQKETSQDDQGEKAASNFVPKLVYRRNSMTREQLDKIHQETSPLTSVLKKSASLELAIRLFEWSQEDLKRKAEKMKGSPHTPSTSSENALAIKLPPNLSRLRDFSIWLLSQSKKLYDLLVPEKSSASQESDDTNTSKDRPPVNPYGDDTLSEITPISTDSESAPGKDKDESSTPETTLDSTNSSSGPKHKRQRSPDDTVSSPKRQRSPDDTVSSPKRQRSPDDTVSSPKRQTI